MGSRWIGWAYMSDETVCYVLIKLYNFKIYHWISCFKGCPGNQESFLCREPCLVITNTKTEVKPKNETILQTDCVILCYNETFSSPASAILTNPYTLMNSCGPHSSIMRWSRRGWLPSFGGAEKSKIQRCKITHTWSSIEPEMGCGFSDSLYDPVNFLVYLYLKLLFSSDSERMPGMGKKKGIRTWPFLPMSSAETALPDFHCP